MSGSAWMRRLAVPVLAVVGLAVVGCPSASNQGLPIGSDADDTMVMPASSTDALGQATDRYKSLLATMAPADARTALVQEWSGSGNVASATLGRDGTTISLQLADGLVVIIDTSSSEDEAVDAQKAANIFATAAKAADGFAGQKAVGGLAAREIAGSAGSCNAVKTSSRKAKIVAPVTETNPSRIPLVEGAKDKFVALGWQASDVTLRYRKNTNTVISAEDFAEGKAVVPDDFLDLRGYGVVLIWGHGGVGKGPDGQDHFYLQCADGGDYHGLIDEGLRTLYKTWVANGTMVPGTAKSEVTGDWYLEWYLSDEVFKNYLVVDPGTMVHIVSCSGWELQDEFVSHGAASFSSWDGHVRGASAGISSWLNVFGAMSAPAAKTDEQAVAAAQSQGLGASTDDDGSIAHLQVASIAGDYYLPSWGSVFTSPGDVPDGTATIEAAIKYADCSAAKIDFTLDPAETLDLDYLYPKPASVILRALDGSGKVLGTGAFDQTFHAGLNNIELKTCTASAKPVATQYLTEGAHQVVKIHAEFVPNEPAAPTPAALEFAPTESPSWDGLWAGSGTLTAMARDQDGQMVARTEQPVTVVCGDNTLEVCFGWVKLVSRKYPYNATRIQVTSDGGNASWPVTLAPGGSMIVVGYDLHQALSFTAEAFDSFDHSLGQQTVSMLVGCGENAVAFDIINYGIIVSTDKGHLLADGQDSAVVTATLKEWKTGDTVTPTGDPVVGKSVHFDTTLGVLSGTNPGVTDSNGQASVTLTGTQAGQAQLHAFVPEDVVENTRMVYVTFGGNYGIVLTTTPGQVTTVIATLRMWKDGDTSQPTGDPVAGKQVAFSTDFGTLSGVNPVTTGAAGVATIQIGSAIPGTATVKATVAADNVEATCPVVFAGNWVEAQTWLTGTVQPLQSFPANYLYAVPTWWSIVAGAHTYELEIYNNDPSAGGTFVNRVFTAGTPNPDGTASLQYVIAQGSIPVANQSELYAATGSTYQQYGHYWVRVRVSD